VKVILGITGCIGAYKAAVILRLLQKAGLEVAPVMTRHAQEFISPLTFQKLSGNEVITDLFRDHSPRIEHIALARNSNCLLVAPATANILGKFAHGVADDFLSTLYLSTLTPVVIAPAMNVEMWHHPATQENIRILRQRGVILVEPAAGYLACGEEGEGRLAEPEEVVQAVFDILQPRKTLRGQRVLVTAGPTIEDIDPVRFLSNHSSGKMGYSLAREAQQRGAHVVLVSGPSLLEPPEGVDRVQVRSAAEMAGAVIERFPKVDVVIMAAAVSDFTPLNPSAKKTKKGEGELILRLERTTDVLQELGRKKGRQLLVGFAAESHGLRENARKKMREKRLDLVVANDISQVGQGFQADLNQVIVIDAEGGEEAFPVLPKAEVARIIWDRIEKKLTQQLASPEA
jgi:phosphopantothenoylcysteine decarboxylase/phosphopantothenate--cysteine ligase